jgi:folate-binding protein YgfZ
MLEAFHCAAGAEVAPDGIPLRYGDLKAEYRAALEAVVLMDRSHEGRIELRGRDRIEIVQRISTNDLSNLPQNQGRPTIFTNPVGRILDRAIVYNMGESALLLAEAGRGAPVYQYLTRQIFFNDEAQLVDVAPSTALFALHGPKADTLLEAFLPDASRLPPYALCSVQIAGVGVTAARRKSVSAGHWALVVPRNAASTVWKAVEEAGALPAGSLTYNALRIRAGIPAPGRELSTDYIPLEAGLWDEVSFAKGCYTGQEIIARMESRGRLAKTMVQMRLNAPVEAPAELLHDGKAVGTLTSSVTTPDGEIVGLGFVKLPLAEAGLSLHVGDNSTTAEVTALAGAQPPND